MIREGQKNYMPDLNPEVPKKSFMENHTAVKGNLRGTLREAGKQNGIAEFDTAVRDADVAFLTMINPGKEEEVKKALEGMPPEKIRILAATVEKNRRGVKEEPEQSR